MECSRRHDLSNPSHPHFVLSFLVYGNGVGIMLHDSMPRRPYATYECRLWTDGPFSYSFRISTCKPIDNMEIGEARRLWEALVRDHGWSRVGGKLESESP